MHFQLPQLVFIVDRFAVEHARGMHPLSRSPMRGERARLRSMLAVEGTGGPDGAVKGYAAHCLRMRCLARGIRRTIADDFGPEVLGQVKHGYRGGAPEGVGYCYHMRLADVYASNINPKKTEGSLRQDRKSVV